MQMNFKFVASDETGSSQKRQQVQRACERCRKRKKRCFHAISGSNASPALAQNISYDSHGDSAHRPTSTSPAITTQVSGDDLLQRPSGRDLGIEVDSATEETQTESSEDGSSQKRLATIPIPKDALPNIVPLGEERNPRFIGDMCPEGVFLAATSPDTTRADDSIGIWLTSTLNKRASQPPSTSLQSTSNLFYGSGSLIQKVLAPMLEQECLSMLPPAPQREALSKIYFEKVHLILPAIDEKAYRSFADKDPGKLLLQQGICLAASKHLAARQYLILPESDRLLSSREFGARLLAAMRMSIEMGLVTNKFVVIQALTVMSQFVDNPVGDDISSQLCGKAFFLIQFLGLHLKGRQDEEIDRSNTTLLCCVWAIDRLNSAMYGRPFLMHERDIRQDISHCFEQQEPCFRVLLQILVLLERVIVLYRPIPGHLDVNFPSFEEVVISCGASHIAKSALATVEMLYHAVAILSCRTKTWQEPQRTSASYLRQNLSTLILSSTVASDLQDQITLFPFVPYSISLSLSVAYREMRHSKLPFHRARSRQQFQTLCDALAGLSGAFWSASTTSEMGKKLLKEMDRVFYTVSDKKPQPNSSSNGANKEHTFYQTPPGQEISESQFPQAMQPSNEYSQNDAMQDFDPSSFESLGDLDLFGMFDPSFDLDGFDATLEGNLNLALPTYFQ